MSIRISFGIPAGKSIPGYTITHDERGKTTLLRTDRKQVHIQVDTSLHNAFCLVFPISEILLPDWLADMTPLKTYMKEKMACDTLMTGWYSFHPIPDAEQVTCEVTSLPGARIAIIVNGLTPRAVLTAYKAVLTGAVQPVKPYKRTLKPTPTKASS